MKAIDECFVYQGDIKKLTKANSFTVSGRLVYVVKKDYTCKSVKVYCCYDVDTKVLLASHWDKDKLISYMSDKDLSIFGGGGSLF